MDGGWYSGQSLVQIVCRHHRHQLNLGIQSEGKALNYFGDLRRLLHIDNEKPASLAIERIKIGSFWFEIFRKLLSYLLKLAAPNCAVAELNRDRELNHHPHSLPPACVSADDAPDVRRYHTVKGRPAKNDRMTCCGVSQ